ncbi:hypothetical protein NC651_006357 [Populus alba x Populus x berolinensis]|nr:hypothetical protein NC651_006357 [Populus alba x Populus x berolinensis]
MNDIAEMNHHRQQPPHLLLFPPVTKPTSSSTPNTTKHQIRRRPTNWRRELPFLSTNNNTKMA